MLTAAKKGEYRFYTDSETGKEYVSVTSCLSLLPKPAVLIWAINQTVKYFASQKKITPQILSNAYGISKSVLNQLAAQGTERHNTIEAYLKTGKVDPEDNSLKRFRKWEEESGFQIEAIEKALCNDKLRSAGTADLIGNCSGVPILVDLKTSKAIRFSHKVQAAVYKYMLGEPNRKVGILLIPRVTKTTYQFYILTEEEEKEYLKIYWLLVNLFFSLLKLGEIDLNYK